MELQRNKTLTTIALILTLTFAATLVALPAATAQEPPRKKTYAFIGAMPNPVGVGQTVLLHVGIFTATATGEYSWKGLTITVTKPDGTTETLGPFQTDATGGTGTMYTPDQVGTYYLQSHFPEQENPVTFFQLDRGAMLFEGTVMEASSSEELALVVQEEAIEYYPGAPLPTEYWDRPIDSQLREWSSISGNWLWMSPNLYVPYNDGPESAHILWTKPLKMGGIVGGQEYGTHNYFIGDAYEGEWGGSVIINGILYYNKYHSSMVYGEDLYEPLSHVPPGVYAVDLRTGEELWYNNEFRLAFGQVYYFTSPNQHGASAYLWSTIGSTWHAYDAYTGDWSYTIENVPGGTSSRGPNGEILITVVDTTNGWMALWNSSAIPRLHGGGSQVAVWMWRPWEKTVDGQTGYSWNVTIPAGLPGTVNAVADDRVLGYYLSPERDQVTSWALSLKPGEEGTLLFNTTWHPPAEWETGGHVIHFGGATDNGEDGVFALFSKELRRFYGFSFDNGEFLWETESESYLDAYGWGRMEHEWLFAYDKLYSTGVSGIMYCYDAKTGETLWTYAVDDPYQEYLFANNWWQRTLFITDGKVYAGHAEHSPIDPRPRGGPFICLDAETGDVIWRADGLFRQTHWGGRAIIGDSIIATMDTYDMRIYAIGKGPSKTAVTAPDTGIPLGSSVMIRGTVTDVSPGTKEYALTARFPNGVPAVADEYMSEWMKYVYKQFPAPMGATGVSVHLEAFGADGSYIDIGRVTSDGYGMYKMMWTPEAEGEYIIAATFEGSKSYWASYAETAIGVDPAPAAYPEAPSAEDVAQKTIDKLPAYPEIPEIPTAENVAQETINRLPAYPEPAEIPEVPAYLTIDLVIIAAVAVAIIIGLYSIVKKQK